jgi:hypothetical protein
VNKKKGVEDTYKAPIGMIDPGWVYIRHRNDLLQLCNLIPNHYQILFAPTAAEIANDLSGLEIDFDDFHRE